MKGGLIAALVVLLLVLLWPRGERYSSFNSQIADLDTLVARENLLHFTDADFNQVGSKEIRRY